MRNLNLICSKVTSSTVHKITINVLVIYREPAKDSSSTHPYKMILHSIMNYYYIRKKCNMIFPNLKDENKMK